MSRVSMWTSFFIDLTPEEATSCIARHGYRYAELSDEHGIVLLGRGRASAAGAALKKHADNLGVKIAQGHLRLLADIVEPNARKRRETLDDIKKWLELFNALDIKAAVLHPGGKKAVEAGWSEERISGTRSESLSVLCEASRGTPTLICLENMQQNADDLLQMIKESSVENLGICFDTGHLNCLGDRKPGKFIKKAGSRLKALHIADNLGTNDDHLFPYGGRLFHDVGRVDWAEVMKALKDVRYKGLFNYEIPGESHGCPMAVREAKLDYALKLAKILARTV